VLPDRTNLSFGSGTPTHGRKIYTEGIHTAKTIANCYAHATTVFDYISGAMPTKRRVGSPRTRPMSSPPIFSFNKLIGENDAMRVKSLPQVKIGSSSSRSVVVAAATVVVHTKGSLPDQIGDGLG
jgi:hypothetical protein